MFGRRLIADPELQGDLLNQLTVKQLARDVPCPRGERIERRTQKLLRLCDKSLVSLEGCLSAASSGQILESTPRHAQADVLLGPWQPSPLSPPMVQRL